MSAEMHVLLIASGAAARILGWILKVASGLGRKPTSFLGDTETFLGFSWGLSTFLRCVFRSEFCLISLQLLIHIQYPRYAYGLSLGRMRLRAPFIAIPALQQDEQSDAR